MCSTAPSTSTTMASELMSCPSCFLFQTARHSNGCCESCGAHLFLEQQQQHHEMMTVEEEENVVDGRDDASGDVQQEEEDSEGLSIFFKDKSATGDEATSWGEKQSRNKKRPPQSPTMSTTTMTTTKTPPSCPWGGDVPRNKPRVATPPVPSSSKRPRLLSPRDSPDDRDNVSQAINKKTSSSPPDAGEASNAANTTTTTGLTTKSYSNNHVSRDATDATASSSKSTVASAASASSSTITTDCPVDLDILSRRDSLFGNRLGNNNGSKAFYVHDLTTMNSNASSSFMLEYNKGINSSSKDDHRNSKDDDNHEDELWILAGYVFPIAASAACAASKNKKAVVALDSLPSIPSVKQQQQQPEPQEISPSTPKKQRVQCPSVAPSMPYPSRSSSFPPSPLCSSNNTMSSSTHRYSPNAMMCAPIVHQQHEPHEQQQQQPRLLFSQHVQRVWSAKLSAPQRTDILVATLPVTKTAAHRWRVHYEKDHPPTSTSLWKMILKCADALGCRSCRRDEHNIEHKSLFLGSEKWQMLRQNLIAYFEHETFVKRRLETVQPLPRERHGKEVGDDDKRGMECLVCCERYHPQDVSVCTGTGKHGLCRCCLRQYVTETSPARDLSCIVCPAPECTSMLSPAAIQDSLSTWDKLRFQEQRDAAYNNSIKSPATMGDSSQSSYSSSSSAPPPREMAVTSPTVAETAWSCECGASGFITEQGIASGRVCCTGCRLEFCVHCGRDWHTGDCCPVPNTNDDDDRDRDEAQWQQQLAPSFRPFSTTAARSNVPYHVDRNHYFHYTAGREHKQPPSTKPMTPMSADATRAATAGDKAVASLD